MVTPSSGVTTPPTDEQMQAAAKMHECHRDRYIGDDFYRCVTHDTMWPCEVAETTAQALADQAAAIHARYEKVAEGLDELYQAHHENWRTSGSTYAEGISAGLGLASDRVREVPR